MEGGFTDSKVKYTLVDFMSESLLIQKRHQPVLSLSVF